VRSQAERKIASVFRQTAKEEAALQATRVRRGAARASMVNRGTMSRVRSSGTQRKRGVMQGARRMSRASEMARRVHADSEAEPRRCRAVPRRKGEQARRGARMQVKIAGALRAARVSAASYDARGRVASHGGMTAEVAQVSSLQPRLRKDGSASAVCYTA